MTFTLGDDMAATAMGEYIDEGPVLFHIIGDLLDRPDDPL